MSTQQTDPASIEVRAVVKRGHLESVPYVEFEMIWHVHGLPDEERDAFFLSRKTELDSRVQACTGWVSGKEHVEPPPCMCVVHYALPEAVMTAQQMRDVCAEHARSIIGDDVVVRAHGEANFLIYGTCAYTRTGVVN